MDTLTLSSSETMQAFYTLRQDIQPEHTFEFSSRLPSVRFVRDPVCDGVIGLVWHRTTRSLMDGWLTE